MLGISMFIGIVSVMAILTTQNIVIDRFYITPHKSNNKTFQQSVKFSALDAPSKRHEIQEEAFDITGPLPWGCALDYVWRDLGENYYPRHIREARCSNGSCWYGHFSCVPSIYYVRVLTPNLGSQIDGKIPVSLRNDWIFRNIRVTVGCQCARDNVLIK